MKAKVLLVIAFLCFACATPGKEDASGQRKYSVVIGTASERGVYYPAGRAICKLVNEREKVHGIHCGFKSTEGSISNINSVLAGHMCFAIAQSDRVYQAWYGLGEWSAKGPQKDLRAVFSMHPEAIVLLAPDETGIRTIYDLRGKKVSLGNPRHGLYQLSIDALNNAGIDYESDIKAVNGSLEDRQVDASFHMVGRHPAKYLVKLTSGKRKFHFVTISGIERLLNKYPYYARTHVPMQYYPGATNTDDEETFGVKAILVTSINVPDRVVYTMTKEIFDNFESFKALYPVGELLTKTNMLEGISAPVHPGAVKYYKEAGIK